MKNWKRNFRLTSILASTLLLASACGAPEGGEDTTPAGDDAIMTTAAQPAEPTFTDTIVVFQPDGTSTVRSVQVTQAERDAERIALTEHKAPRAGNSTSSAAGEQLGEAAAPLTADASCDGADLWLYDQPSRTGNKICFAGTGTGGLGSYCRTWATICYMPGNCSTFCTATWLGAVRSIWAGAQIGILAANTNFPCGTTTCDPGFASWEIRETTTLCESAAKIVDLGHNACVPNP